LETVHYLRALGHYWFLVAITVIAGGAGGFLVYSNTTPVYHSTVRMIVSGSGSGQPTDEVTARVLATQRALALSQVADTPPAVRAAAAKAGYPGATPSVSSNSEVDGPFLTVTVTHTSAARAQAIANAFALTLPATMVRLEGRADAAIAVANLAPANRPAKPFSPKIGRDLGLGLAAGLVLGFAIALLREAVNRAVRDSDELAELTGLRVLGAVPRDMPKRALPAVTDPRSARAEAYRQIRTTLLNNADGPPRTIAVTSATVGEGKTSVATNLAAVFNRAGHRVVLVDADLRRPRVSDVFDVDSEIGLTDVLARKASLEQALTTFDDGRLALLTSGPIAANPSEALGGSGMKEVLAQLAARYEYVIIDTPPVLPVTDATVLAPMVDGVVLVTRLGRTNRNQVTHAVAAIRRVNATILGLVPNQASAASDRDGRYSYYATERKRGDREPSDVETDILRPHSSARTTHRPAMGSLQSVQDDGADRHDAEAPAAERLADAGQATTDPIRGWSGY
jgi:succinoglycan biosynthesis transport protein ExoP